MARCVLLILLAVLSRDVAAESPITAIVGAKIYPSPGTKPIADGVVLIRNGRITAVGARDRVRVPAGAAVLDASGLIVMAGFHNSHVHFTAPKWNDAGRVPAETLTTQMQEMLTRYGFTSVIDTASMLDNTVVLRKRVESGEVAGPRILTAGMAIYPENGIPYYVREDTPPETLALFLQPATIKEAVRGVQANVEGGADVIKLFTASWVKPRVALPMLAGIASAATAEAHRRGRLVFVHPSDVKGLEIALESRVDVFAHAVSETDGVTESHLRRMQKAKVSLIPTLNLFRRNRNFDVVVKQVGDYARMGGQILFGTDVGNLPDFDPTIEYELLSRAGLSFDEILASLTTAPASRYGVANRRGRVRPAYDADLVVLNGDPKTDVRNFANVRYTIRDGKVIYEGNAGAK